MLLKMKTPSPIFCSLEDLIEEDEQQHLDRTKNKVSEVNLDKIENDSGKGGGCGNFIISCVMFSLTFSPFLLLDHNYTSLCVFTVAVLFAAALYSKSMD